MLSESSYGRIWQQARRKALTSAQARSPLAARPYDLRHSGVICTAFSARGTAQSGACRIVPHKYLAVREACATRPVPGSFSLRCWF